tara:strand:+ start:390 stop:521 length:132 start_codon:yes stop_codon:yes gene_type:complete
MVLDGKFIQADTLLRKEVGEEQEQRLKNGRFRKTIQCSIKKGV